MNRAFNTWEKLLVLSLLLTGARANLAQDIINVNGVVAVVHDMVITRGDVIYLTEPLLISLESQYRDRPQMLLQKRDEALQEGLSHLIERKLILHDFNTAGYNMPESIIEEDIKDRVRKRFGDRVRLIQTLKAEGRTYESFRKEVREQFIEEALRAHHVSSEIIISPYKIEAYYATNQARYQVDDQVKLRMIRVARAAADDLEQVKKRALEILNKIETGTPFAEMAGIYHQGTQPAGDWGWVNNTTLFKGLTDIFFKLKAGEHTGVIGRGNETDRLYWIYEYDKSGKIVSARKYGLSEDKEILLAEKPSEELAAANLVEPQEFYLLQVEETRGSHVQSLADVRAEIESLLIAQERARLQKRWIDRLQEKTFVQRF